MTTAREERTAAVQRRTPATPTRSPEGAREAVTGALSSARHRMNAAPGAVLALQRQAGNAAVGALLAAKAKLPGEQAVVDIDGALREMKRDEPTVEAVEKGLKAAKDAGVPVDLEGQKPPPSALAVTKTGFGPAAVAPKKPVPPPKPVPANTALGKAAAKKPKPAGPAKAAPKGGAPTGGGAMAAAGPALAPLGGDKLLEPPAPPTHQRPEEDPAFVAVKAKVGGVAKAKKAHPPAASKAAEAQGAALAPADDLAGQAKAAKVDTMDAQPAGSFDKQAFITAVKAAIEAKSPKTLKEADDYKSSGKAGEVKGEVKGLVSQGKDGQAKDIEAATEAAPDQSKAVPKPVTPLAQEDPGQPVNVPAVGAVPKPAPAEQTNLEAGKHQANQELADAEVDESQLAKSNEPEFQQALTDKQAAAAHADTAPGEFRQQEKAELEQNKAQANEETQAGMAGMQGAKAAAVSKLVADKGKTKSKDEAKRAEVTAKVQGIFEATEADVKKILDGIDPKVEAAFAQGEAKAKAIFESYVDSKMSAYKKDRYGGWLGGIKWAKDKLMGMPDKVNEFYDAGRELYMKEMDVVISKVADIVGNDLTAAKTRIAQGKTEIATYVKSLPGDLQKVGSEASQEINDKFEQLEDDVNSKQEAVVDGLATKYVESRKGLDERIEALQAENKGLVDKAIGAIKAVVNTIRELAAMLKNALAKAASFAADIIKNPIGFLGNLIAGVKGGILKFRDTISDHLRKGLMGWLFGALAEAGVELPETFDIKGIVKLLASIFGLTWANIRNRIVKQVGEKAMGAIEKGVEVFQVIATQGIGGLWQMLIEKLGDIKEMILEQVKDFVITKIITAGITWLIGLLNPAAAFIKACKLIYDVVMFFVSNASRIAKFVTTVVDSVGDIVRGNVGGVVNKINDVLGQMVPILIGFLASVIGLGGIGQKIREIIQKLQKPFNRAIDFVVKTGLKVAGPLIRGIKGIGSKVKAKVAAGKAWVKGKVDKGKAWAKDKAASGLAGLRKLKDRLLGITFRKQFEAAGETHTVYTKKGAVKQLFTASEEKPTAEATPSPRVKQLSSQYVALMSEYVTTVNALDASPRNAALVQKAETLKTQASQVFDDLVAESKTYIENKGGLSKGKDPNKSAPGVGRIGSHGSKPSSLRDGHRLHWLESEHVLPFAVGKSVWRALELYLPWRGSRADSAQPTIMIYERAARIKTEADNATSAVIKDIVTRTDVVGKIARGRMLGAVGMDDAEARDAYARLQALIETVRKNAVSRTVQAVEAENKMVEKGAKKTNGQRRGNEQPTPDSGKIDSAADSQFNVLMKLVEEEVFAKQAVVDKAERIKSKPARGR